MTIHTLKDMMGEMLVDAAEEIEEIECCIDCMKSRISDGHLKILWNRGRIDTISELFDTMDGALNDE